MKRINLRAWVRVYSAAVLAGFAILLASVFSDQLLPPSGVQLVQRCQYLLFILPAALGFAGLLVVHGSIAFRILTGLASFALGYVVLLTALFTAAQVRVAFGLPI